MNLMHDLESKLKTSLDSIQKNSENLVKQTEVSLTEKVSHNYSQLSQLIEEKMSAVDQRVQRLDHQTLTNSASQSNLDSLVQKFQSSLNKVHNQVPGDIQKLQTTVAGQLRVVESNLEQRLHQNNTIIQESKEQINIVHQQVEKFSEELEKETRKN